VDKARLKAKPLKAQWTVPNVDGRIPFPLMEAPDLSGASMRNFSISLLSPAFLIPGDLGMTVSPTTQQAGDNTFRRPGNFLA
jgi:hypothetical protein